jgi:hypothetical protein
LGIAVVVPDLKEGRRANLILLKVRNKKGRVVKILGD